MIIPDGVASVTYPLWPRHPKRVILQVERSPAYRLSATASDVASSVQRRAEKSLTLQLTTVLALPEGHSWLDTAIPGSFGAMLVVGNSI
jgi:hypothetical protein